MLCNICKKNPAVIFSSKEENGVRKKTSGHYIFGIIHEKTNSKSKRNIISFSIYFK